MEFNGCQLTRFGGPNDEGRPEHPLHHRGLSQLGYAISEVLDSTWAEETMARARKTAERIWRPRGNWPYKDSDWIVRHFLVGFHDSTFEALAEDFTLEVLKQPFEMVIADVQTRLLG